MFNHVFVCPLKVRPVNHGCLYVTLRMFPGNNTVYSFFEVFEVVSVLSQRQLQITRVYVHTHVPDYVIGHIWHNVYIYVQYKVYVWIEIN